MRRFIAGLLATALAGFLGACGGGSKGTAKAAGCARRLEGGSWRAVKWRHLDGRGAPEVAAEYYMANADTVYQNGRWETFLDGRADGHGIARVWGGTYRVKEERGDRCTIELTSVEEPQTPIGPLPIRFLGPDRFEVMEAAKAERVVFARNRTRDAAWLRAEARRNPPASEAAASGEGQPEDDIYHGTGADRWK